MPFFYCFVALLITFVIIIVIVFAILGGDSALSTFLWPSSAFRVLFLNYLFVLNKIIANICLAKFSPSAFILHDQIYYGSFPTFFEKELYKMYFIVFLCMQSKDIDQNKLYQISVLSLFCFVFIPSCIKKN